MSDTALIVLGENLTPSIAGDFAAQEAAALEASALIAVVKSPAQNKTAELAAAQITALIKAVEKSRKAIKEPYLEACRKIDATAASAVTALKNEELRLNGVIGDFAAEQLAEARRKEVERQEELRRIARQEAEERARIEREAQEAERKRQEALRVAEEARQAEFKRLEQLAKDEKTAKQAVERAAALAKERDLAQAESLAAALKADQDLAENLKRQSELAAQAIEAVGPQKAIAKVAGQVVKPVWKFDVVNIWELVRARPDLVRVEPNTSAINEAIAQGLREAKGIRIYEDVAISRRKLGGQQAIDI